MLVFITFAFVTGTIFGAITSIIMKDILTAVMESRSIKITRLIYRSNLTHQSIKPYIAQLLEQGLLELVKDRGGKQSFRITPRGDEFLQEYQKIKIFSESFGLE